MPHEVSLGWLNQRGWYRHACKRGEMHTKFWQGNVNAEDHLAELGIISSIILGWIVGTYLVRIWTGFICLRTGSISMLFKWKFQKKGRISWPPQWLLTSQERLTPWSEFWCTWKSRTLSTSGRVNPSLHLCSSSYFLPQTQKSTHDKNNYLRGYLFINSLLYSVWPDTNCGCITKTSWLKCLGK